MHILHFSGDVVDVIRCQDSEIAFLHHPQSCELSNSDLELASMYPGISLALLFLVTKVTLLLTLL